MWLKMKSLSFKLTMFYIVSIFLIMGGTIAYIEYNKYERAVWDTLRNIEIGPGFINGAAPDNADEQILYNNPDSAYVIKPADIENSLARFKSLFDEKTIGGVGVSSSIDGPVNINHQDYYNLSFDITNAVSGSQYKVGPVTIPKSQFPATVAAADTAFQSKRLNDFYYLPVPGHDDLVFLVSVNRYDFPVPGWKSEVVFEIASALPFILLLSVIFALLIIWITVLPLRRITRTTELISRSDLSQRVKVNSSDEIGRLARSFNTMADRLEESFNSQKRFISDAAHELRTPLASMKTSVTRTISAERNTGDYQKILDFLSGRINYMETMVNDMLFLSRVDEGKLKSGEARLDLSRVLTETEEVFRYLFEDKGILFSAEIEPKLKVKGDPKLMLRVISNLLDNAARHTPSGGTVVLKAMLQKNEVVVTVSDTGSGISPEHLPHLFKRFYKIPDSSGTGTGYGLGLAISKSIVVASGGDISLQSEPGKGSTFTIKLPQY
jgi:two-component system, OmpR family, heavy metal sensor histidine kinase CusS